MTQIYRKTFVRRAASGAGNDDSDDDAASIRSGSTARSTGSRGSRGSRAKSADPELQAKVRDFLLERYEFVDPLKKQEVI